MKFTIYLITVLTVMLFFGGELNLFAQQAKTEKKAWQTDNSSGVPIE